MNATFVQVQADELSRFEADPSSVESLFHEETGMPDAFIKLAKTMQDRVRDVGPQMLADTLSRLDPRLQQRLAERLGKTPADWARGLTGNEILNMMEQRRSASTPRAGGTRAILSLDKSWHGVHYVLCGDPEAGTSLLGQAVLGGTALGDDAEGFSGYGPARYFTPAKVAELADALSRPELESEAAGRFDPKRMSELGIYPGWQSSDAQWVLDGFRSLRDFYSDAATKGHAIVTCLV